MGPVTNGRSVRSDNLYRRRTMAQVDYFLKLAGIDGESHDAKHKGEIDVESWSWGETNAGDAAHRGGMGAGKVSMQDLHFTMKVNKATPRLMQACATGEHIAKAVLTCRVAGGSRWSRKT